ncbi:lamin tail domain-containing protein [Flavitalea flava]
MKINLPRLSIAKFLIRKFSVFVFLFICSHANAQIRITEYMYSGANGEFVEFTNVGNSPVDMTGWSFDDATRNLGVHYLTAFGVVQPGESVIVTETTPVSAFRAAWGLCAGVKITGGYTNDNLGRADEINLYDSTNTLVDRLTYNDQTLGGPRTQNKSAWVSAAGLGANTPAQWTLSAAGDAEGSFVSSGGDIGSPGKSTRATVPFNPCIVVDGAPTIIMNVASTTNYLDGGVTASPASPFFISGAADDSTDPARFSGIDFIIGDDLTPVEQLTVTVASNNLTVVPIANIQLTGTGTSRNIKIKPSAVGYATITISVNDGVSTTPFVLLYAASAAAAMPADTRWHTGISDASDAVALDSSCFITGDDEQNVLNVYSRSNSGLPLVSYNYTANLNLPDPAKPEVDVEAAAPSLKTTNRIYWLGSMSNGKSPFDNKPNRNRLFATDVSGTEAATSFSFAGYYGNLRTVLLAWGDAHGYGFSASAAAGIDSKSPAGFAAEGMVFGPDSTTLYIGLRAPLVPTANRTKAVIVPLLNFETWFNNGAPAGDPQLALPIELSLGGRGIRDLIRLPNGTYIVLAGNPGEAPLLPAIYKWSGLPGDSVILVSTLDSTQLNMEGAMAIYENGQLSLSKLQLITDKGGDVLYNDGIEAKSLGDNKLKKFRSDRIGGLDLLIHQPPADTQHIVITSPTDNSTFDAGTPIHLQALVTPGDSNVVRVAFFSGSNKFAEDSVAPYAFTGVDIAPGNYPVSARAYTSQGDSLVSDTIHILIAGCTATGSILGEGYTGIPGNTLINLASSAKYPNHPDITAQLNKFEYGPQIGDNYGARVRGYICAPLTGNYVFYLASDEQSELWLSTDESPSHGSRIAFVEKAVGFRAWLSTSSQQSAPVRLVKGVRYYVETVHKEGTGNDHLSVGWVLPGGVFEGPIGGYVLSPFEITEPQPQTAAADFAAAMRVASAGLNDIRQTPSAEGKELTVTVSPNPSSGYFTISTHSGSEAPVSFNVADLTGRRVESRDRLPANGTIQLGGTYPKGIYILEIAQGGKTIRLKLLKL